MNILTPSDLWHMTRLELLTLEKRLSLQTAELPEGSDDRRAALLSLRSIRKVLTRTRSPGPS